MSNAPASHDEELQAFIEQVLKTYGSNGMSQEQNLAALQLYYQHLQEQDDELARYAPERLVLWVDTCICILCPGRSRGWEATREQSENDARTFAAR